MATGIEYQVGELLRELREKRGLSVRTLAANAGFSPSFISQVENGQASPSIASLEKMAACLDITLSEFFQAGAARSSAVVRAHERPRLESGWSKAEIESLGAGRGSRLEPVLITLRGGGMSGKHPHTLARDQFVFVISGDVTLMLDDVESVLSPGDAATISAQTPYRFVNPSETPTQFLVVSSRGL
jgi:transcriptional regulator with XRE-family HTH domain